MVDLIYGLCALTAALCCWLLLLGYFRSRYRLLLWGGLCFAGLTLNNIFVIMDKVFFLQMDLSVPRMVTSLAAMIILLYGLIWDTES